jgi:ribose 1,5-bisphosphate isomerase
MDQLQKDANRIRNLEIQGATNVALEAINFLSYFAKRIKSNDVKQFLAQLNNAMKNGLHYIMNKLTKSKSELFSSNIPVLIEKFKEEYREMLENSKLRIAEIGARRIPEVERNNDFIVMTHCHSSAVTAILLEAKRQGKDNFKVINTETQPKLQGRQTAKELLDADIEVIHVVDSAMRWVVNHFEVDLILVGADSITSEGTVLNKIGTRLLALVAHEEHVPFYVASPLLKYNPKTNFGMLEKIEMRDPNEIWNFDHRNLRILNPAFETVSRRYIDGLITEAGIFASSHVPYYFNKLYPELLD